MIGTIGTVLYAGIAAIIVFGIILPLQKLFFPHYLLKEKSEMVGFVFLFLVISPLMALIWTMIIILAFFVLIMLGKFIEWATNFDLLYSLTPDILTTMSGGKILIIIYVTCCVIIFANGIRMTLITFKK